MYMAGPVRQGTDVSSKYSETDTMRLSQHLYRVRHIFETVGARANILEIFAAPLPQYELLLANKGAKSRGWK